MATTPNSFQEHSPIAVATLLSIAPTLPSFGAVPPLPTHISESAVLLFSLISDCRCHYGLLFFFLPFLHFLSLSFRRPCVEALTVRLIHPLSTTTTATSSYTTSFPPFGSKYMIFISGSTWSWSPDAHSLAICPSVLMHPLCMGPRTPGSRSVWFGCISSRCFVVARRLSFDSSVPPSVSPSLLLPDFDSLWM
ncbi:uncharacterized protein BJ171DRAFT_269590 [Polychytrium aggregatum]|uniref:uncharacterized protein n=1 Tax=Polychytrium aggregatum TaxID=110093 RepID=UPI0022FE6E88|nr:uncharacterized protein BJ171DRAFT_269590 [Polychytrium aggregatum]KAI9193416.1 hypothetical protein BJ171DRAFT_269590 [Polychytrium aggregatum]